MNLHEATTLARRLADEMLPYCLRVEVAGSVRRGKSECRDLEIVAIPRWQEVPDPLDLFGEATVRENELHRWATGAAVQWIKPATSEVIPWAPQPTGRYWRGVLACGTKLDVFLTVPECWGTIFLIRTGSAEFSKAIVAYAKQIGMRFHDGLLVGRGGTVVATPEEADVFAALGLAWVEPAERTGPEALRVGEAR